MKLQRVGDYLLGEKLGEGSFAKVRVGLHVISREKVSDNKKLGLKLTRIRIFVFGFHPVKLTIFVQNGFLTYIGRNMVILIKN